MSTPLTRQISARCLPLRQRWQAYAKRIDNLSLRERAFIFLSLAAILIAAADSLVLTPLKLEAQAQAKAQLKQNQDLKVLRDQFNNSSAQVSKPGGSGGNSTQDQIAQLRNQLANAMQEQARLRQAVDTGFQGLSQDQSHAPLADLLATLLKQHERLSLIKLNSLAEGLAPAQYLSKANPAAATAAAAALPAPAPAAASAATPSGFQWQGLELQISGDYLDQMRYLQHLEQALPRLHWGELRIWSQGDGKPVLLQVQVFLPRARI